jgi:polysaccharide pyruvyl transferase WcaK-like protein
MAWWIDGVSTMKVRSSGQTRRSAVDSRFRILVDCGDYSCGNLGDVAMLQVAFRRLRGVFPGASLEVLTDAPGALAAHCPEASPVPRKGRDEWFGGVDALDRFGWLLPKASEELQQRIVRLRRESPKVWEAIVRVRLRLHGSSGRDVHAFLGALLGADLCVVAGAGGITDHAHAWSQQMLNLLELAGHRGIPTAMFSHGLGPLTNGMLRARAAAVLSGVQVIALREKRAGMPLLRSLNVSGPSVHVTGDDAIELAYEARPTVPGEALGVNLRVARSADVGPEFIGPLREVLQGFARSRSVRLLPVPIGLGQASQDAATLKEMLGGDHHSEIGDADLDTPAKVIRQIGRCRIVVTGAYHAAVFALSQGIPAVCLARSPYFLDKFLGLADQFGRGCEVVFLDAADPPARLTAAMEAAWLEADQLRPGLTAAARKQIATSQAAYEDLAGLIGRHSGSSWTEPTPFRSVAS